MTAGHNETALVRAISHNKFIDQLFYLAATVADDGDQGDAITDARLYKRR